MGKIYLYSEGNLSRVSLHKISVADKKLHTVWETDTPTYTADQIHKVLRRSHLSAGLYAVSASEAKATIEKHVADLELEEQFDWPMFWVKLTLLPFAVAAVIYVGVIAGFFVGSIFITTLLAIAALVRKG